MQDISRGAQRTRIWPSPRGKPKTKAEAERQELFRLVQKMAVWFAPDLLLYIYKATKNSPLLVRDIVTMQLFNRWIAFDLEDGRTLWPMPARNDVSDALDILTNVVGDFLIRGATGWVGASTLPSPPGTIGQGVAYLSADLARPSGAGQKFPFNAVPIDPHGWWTGLPDYGWRPDVPGFYHVELVLQPITAAINYVAVKNAATGTYLALGSNCSANEMAVLSTMLELDGNTTVTSDWFMAGASSIRGAGDYRTRFKITGPF